MHTYIYVCLYIYIYTERVVFATQAMVGIPGCVAMLEGGEPLGDPLPPSSGGVTLPPSSGGISLPPSFGGITLPPSSGGTASPPPPGGIILPSASGRSPVDPTRRYVTTATKNDVKKRSETRPEKQNVVLYVKRSTFDAFYFRDRHRGRIRGRHGGPSSSPIFGVLIGPIFGGVTLERPGRGGRSGMLES